MLVLATITAPAGAQAPHHRRIGFGRLALLGQQLRAGARHFAGDVEQILDGDDRAVERPERNAGLGARIGGFRRGLACIAIDGEAGARALALLVIDARERGVEPRRRRTRHTFKPPFFSMNCAISSTPLPSRILVKTKGRCPRIFLASRSITSSEAPTYGARSVLLMTSRSERVMPGPPLRRDLVAGRDVDDVDREIGELGREGRGEVVAAGFDQHQIEIGKLLRASRRRRRD